MGRMEVMRIDKFWCGWGFSHDSHWTRIHTPFGSVGVDSFRGYDKPGISRGRCHERQLHIPLTRKWQIKLSTRGKDYLTLVKAPSYLKNLNWVIDEFDSSFNDLAIASLRYHLDFSICDNESRRDVYEDLIARLGEEPPDFTDEEMAILQPPGWKFEDDFEPLPGGGSRLRESTPEQGAVYRAFRVREDEHHARIQQARHDLIDILPHLWS